MVPSSRWPSGNLCSSKYPSSKWTSSKSPVTAYVISNVLKLLVQDAVNYLFSMAISILGILGLWVFWPWVFRAWVFWAWVFCPAIIWVSHSSLGFSISYVETFKVPKSSFESDWAAWERCNFQERSVLLWSRSRSRSRSKPKVGHFLAFVSFGIRCFFFKNVACQWQSRKSRRWTLPTSTLTEETAAEIMIFSYCTIQFVCFKAILKLSGV